MCDCGQGSGGPCNDCPAGSFGSFPYCYVPPEGFCDTSLCSAVAPTLQTQCFGAASDCSACGGVPATCGEDPPLPLCGQDAQYEDNERTLTCYRADGDLQDPCDGSADPHEVVVDSLTGLMWQRTIELSLGWQDAIDHCAALDYAGHTDWRLPSPHELQTIGDDSRYSQAQVQPAFPTFPNNWNLWTSAAVPSEASRAYSFSTHDGAIGYDWTNSSYSARCVRGATRDAAEEQGLRYVEFGNTEIVVLDTITGLQWTRDHALAQLTWSESLAYCEWLRYGGHTDWRLPNKKELMSLADYSRSSPASGFPHSPSGNVYLWSSSTHAQDTARAWRLSLENGTLGETDKDVSSPFHARCVRGGP